MKQFTKLNTETAQEYVREYFAHCTMATVPNIVRVTCWKKINHPPMVTVAFTLDGKPHIYGFDVWLENGFLYGEW